MQSAKWKVRLLVLVLHRDKGLMWIVETGTRRSPSPLAGSAVYMQHNNMAEMWIGHGIGPSQLV